MIIGIRPTRSPRKTVLEAVFELHANSAPVTPEALVRHTKLRLTAVKDALDALCRSGEIARESRGRYKPCAPEIPSRPITVTHLADEFRKVEIGDEALDLTPMEARMLGGLLQGSVLTHINMQISNDVAVTLATNQQLLLEARKREEEFRKRLDEANKKIAKYEMLVGPAGLQP